MAGGHRSLSLTLLSLSGLFQIILVQCAGDSAGLASQLGLSSSTVLPFPSASTPDAAGFIKSNWGLQGGINFGEKALAFVDDPFPSPGSGSGSGSVVLSVAYEAGSYSHGTGGANFYAAFGGSGGGGDGNSTGNNKRSSDNNNNAESSGGFEAMLLSYDIAFDQDFDWMKGGKLPGLRGGPKLDSCSGGKQPTGSDCFSSRLMWRAQGGGEVYAYIPSQKSLCSVDGVVCNSDYGFSLGREKFKFTVGQWQNVGVYAKMNSPPSESNGEFALYFNGAQVFSYSNLKIRTSDAVKAGGMYFSTFFGGNDKSWATPNEVHTYYRNFQMFAGAGSSFGGTGSTSNSSDPSGSTDS